VSKLGKQRPGARPDRGRPRTANHPDLVDVRPTGVLFSEVGSTGWRRRRDIRNHKGNKKEGDFSHLHAKFTEEEA
jgi:hypothetical protein